MIPCPDEIYINTITSDIAPVEVIVVNVGTLMPAPEVAIERIGQ